jgi:Domain of Unknown Function (DUF1080)/Protein of unknown function with HXXEE motif
MVSNRNPLWGVWSQALPHTGGVVLQPPEFVILNRIGCVVMTIGVALVNESRRWRWVLTALGGIVLLNAAMHAIGSVVTRSDSPGLVTGLVLWIPLGLFTLRREVRSAARPTFLKGVLAVVVFHALLALFMLSVPLSAADWKPLFNGKNLDGWEVRGDGQWTVMRDGAILGQRISNLRKQFVPGGPLTTPKDFKNWVDTQSWLYTIRNDFGEFDLHLEYWTKTTGNSGVSIRDTSRAAYAIVTPADFTKTPSKIGYEIQINNRYPDPHPSGSIYGFVDAPKTLQYDDDWNSMDISSRNDKITVMLNGKLAAEHPGDPRRSKTGPIGLQLHDQFSIIIFRNVRIREGGK